MTKFQFKIRARGGMIVDNITIAGRDQPDAERKLMQMYMGCQVLDRRELANSERGEAADMDNILALISRQNQEPGSQS
ncbi:MAG: hypothetical protein FJY37_02960 [Betaproteobacteria bacterium]|nr:hypothetical protein [Betaproteobacteria bacterium]